MKKILVIILLHLGLTLVHSQDFQRDSFTENIMKSSWGLEVEVYLDDSEQTGSRLLIMDKYNSEIDSIKWGIFITLMAKEDGYNLYKLNGGNEPFMDRIIYSYFPHNENVDRASELNPDNLTQLVFPMDYIEYIYSSDSILQRIYRVDEFVHYQLENLQ